VEISKIVLPPTRRRLRTGHTKKKKSSVQNPKPKASGEWRVESGKSGESEMVRVFKTQEKTLTYLAVCHCVLNTSNFLEKITCLWDNGCLPPFLRLCHEEAIDCHLHTWHSLIGCTPPTFVTLNAASSSLLLLLLQDCQ
jgi:hypothetical protein